MSSEEIRMLAEEQNHITLAIWAAECAEHVLKCFQELYPEDLRPRMAIEAARSWARGELTVSRTREAAFASHAAARTSEDPSASSAARAAGHAAATAHVASHAIHAAQYAAKAAAGETQWQYQRLCELAFKDGRDLKR